MNTQEITDYIFLEDEDPTGDIGIVLGTWGESLGVDKAVELYGKEAIQKVILSHGANSDTGENEGELLYEKAIEMGIDEDDLFLENDSTNTLENAVLSKELIEKEIGFEDIKTVVLITQNYHARRALMTFKKQFPKGVKLKVSPYIPIEGFTKEDWHESEEGKKLVNFEVKNIQTFLEKGHLEEL